MLISKFSKNLGHYVRYPSDIALLPASIIFGWLHGLIKLYAMVTLDVVSALEFCTHDQQIFTHSPPPQVRPSHGRPTRTFLADSLLPSLLKPLWVSSLEPR